MDKFDDYLEKQSKCEKEKFVLPQSFDRKVEDILLNLDSELKKENNKWYKNKKLWTTAACFAFICLAGMGLSKQIHLGKNEKKQTTVVSEESMMKSAGVRENESNVTHDIESYGLKESGLDNIEDSQVLRADDIYNITIESILATGKPIKAIEQYYINNGFTRNYEGGCCRAKYYDYYSSNGSNPSYGMASINTQIPVSLSAFTSNPNCKVLRDNFATYDEYVDSMMVKYQCGKYGISNEFSSGKENTYKLANCTYIYNYASEVSEQNTLYPAANWAASIDINAPGLQAGNWWLPSAAEMVQMMRNITYGTSFWETKPDIVNRVLYELNNFDSKNWSMLSASTNRWTSSICGQKGAYFYYSFNGILGFDSFNFSKFVAPITLYEF